MENLGKGSQWRQIRDVRRVADEDHGSFQVASFFEAPLNKLDDFEDRLTGFDARRQRIYFVKDHTVRSFARENGLRIEGALQQRLQ